MNNLGLNISTQPSKGYGVHFKFLSGMQSILPVLNGIGFFIVIVQFSLPICAHKLVSALCTPIFWPFLFVLSMALSKPILPANCQRSALDFPESFKLSESDSVPGGQSVLV